jgi:branched-subunit amino acid aminotransferase/4-amino-4-deoxychorismate lyase
VQLVYPTHSYWHSTLPRRLSFDYAALYVVLSPTGPFVRDPNGKGLSLLVMSDQIRAWPGGTGGFKLGLNYAAGFPAQRVAAALGYQQLLWILGETVAEAGAMNVFAVFGCSDGGKRLCCSREVHGLAYSPAELDVVTPPLDGTILPGVTRASVQLKESLPRPFSHLVSSFSERRLSSASASIITTPSNQTRG